MMMKAAICTKYGPPEVLQVKEVETPVPAPDELLVKVKAATVNRTDCGILTASPFIIRLFTGVIKPSRSIPGTDFAGIVEQTGENVKDFQAGDYVFGFDDRGVSSHAEYLTISASKAITKIPDGITCDQAAASIEGAHYAYNFINKIKLNNNDKVLVNGATGAIGSAAVQLLKHYGANVTATSARENIELIKSIGADEVIDYEHTDFTKTDDQYDFILDAVGKSSFRKCKGILKPKGVYISSELGKNSENLFLALITSFSGKQRVIFPIPSAIKVSLNLVEKLLTAGEFKPLIDRSFPLEEIVAAFTYVIAGKKTGNVILKM